MINTTGKIGRDAGGTFRDPSFVSIVAACWTEKVDNCAKQQLSIIVHANIGRIFMTILTSSTCCNEHSRDLCTGLSEMALLRNLRLSVWVSMGSKVSNFDCCSLSISGVGGDGFTPMLTIALLGFLFGPELSSDANRTC